MLKHLLEDEVKDTDTSNLGGGPDLTLDIDKASDQLGAELGLDGNDKDDKDDKDLGSATPPGDKKSAPAPAKDAGAEARARAEAAAKLDGAKKLLTEKKVDFTGKKDEEILALAAAQAPKAKDMPKSWKKEMGEAFSKLPTEVQDYMIQRESQVEEGFKAQAPAVKYAEMIFKSFEPITALLEQQGIKHPQFMQAMTQAHLVLSSKPDAERYPYMASILQNYGLDPAKLAEAYAALGTAKPAQSDAERALQARVAKLETDKNTENSAAVERLKRESAAEVEAFASDPKHPYFDEVAEQVSLFLADPRITLEKAYEMAVYANPVTRAKELDRLKQDAEKTAREEAEKVAAEAARARGTRPKGKEEHRASPDFLGSMEDTMRETLKDINSRT